MASGIFGATLVVTFVAQLALSNSAREFQGAGLIPMICGCVFLFLAFPLFTGREWARKALLLAIYLTLTALAVSFWFLIVQRSSSTSHPALRILIGVCSLVAVLIPPGFILAVLHRAEIRSAYRIDESI